MNGKCEGIYKYHPSHLINGSSSLYLVKIETPKMHVNISSPFNVAIKKL